MTRAQIFRNRPVSDLGELVSGATAPAAPPAACDCCCCCQPAQPPSPPPPPPPPPPNRYELTFAKLYCVDESNPEEFAFWNVSDEPYVVFGVITEEMAESGTPAQAFHTPVYEDVDDGATRPTR